MESPIEQYYFRLPQSIQDTFLYIREYILSYNKDIAEVYKYKIPFYMYKNKWMCYLHHSKTGTYIGFTQADKMPNFNYLKAEGRKFIKVYHINCEADIDLKELNSLLDESF